MGFALHGVFAIFCVLYISLSSETIRKVEAGDHEVEETERLSSRSIHFHTTQPDASGEVVLAANPTTPAYQRTSPPSLTTARTAVEATARASGEVWCIAIPSASQTALQVALDYACGYGGADCSAIQPGGSCYNPDTTEDHASYAFNDYYQKNPTPTSCVFGGTAQLSYSDPSTENCHFASSRTTPSISSPTMPATMTPVATNTPSGSTIYGVAVPTSLPSSSTSIKSSLMLYSTIGVVAWLLLWPNSYF